MIRRRMLIALGVGLACPPLVTLAQRRTNIPAVGVLVTSAPPNDPLFDPLRKGLRDLGYEEGVSISLRIVSAEGQLTRLPALATQLVDQGVDVIIATNEVSTRAAQKATATIPIVMCGYGFDPVGVGLIDDLRRPGGNTTGTYSSTSDLEGKRLEVLKEAVPHVSYVAVLWDPAFGEGPLSDLRRAAKTLHLQLEIIEVRSGNDLQSAFQTAKQKKVGAAFLVFSPLFYVNRDRVAALALETKLPTVSAYAAELNTLMSYGPDAGESLKRAAYYVDRLLKGAKPGQLPVEQISKLKLIVNLRTAKTLGIKIPEPILGRADEVIR